MYPAFLNRISARIFLIDGCGALLSGGGLVLLLVFQPFFGMPADVLYKLLLLPAIFALYAFTCHWNSPENRRNWLRTIAVANISYALATAVLVYEHYDTLEWPGVLYFGVEIPVVGVIAMAEWRISSAPPPIISRDIV